MKGRALTKFVPIAGVALASILVVSACASKADGATPTGSTGNNNITYSQLAANGSISIQSQQQSGIWVDGSGSVKVTPDVAILNLGVEARATAVADARERAAKSMETVNKALKNNSIADADIQTTGFNIQPLIIYVPVTTVPGDTNRPTQPKIIGYVVTNSITVKVRNVLNAGKVIDDATSAGGDAIRFNGISFTLDNPKPQETTARDLAFKDALAKADQAAKAMNVKLGKPTFIQVMRGSPLMEKSIAPSMARGAAADSFTATQINSGELTVVMNIQVVFSIE